MPKRDIILKVHNRIQCCIIIYNYRSNKLRILEPVRVYNLQSAEVSLSLSLTLTSHDLYLLSSSLLTNSFLIHSLLTLTLISSPLKELAKALSLGPKQKNPPNQPRLALVLVWKCSLLVGHAQWGQIRRDNNSSSDGKKGSSVRRSCNELVIYYAPSWRGLINGQRIGSDLAGMSALIGRVRSSTAFAKLMQIMRGQHKMMMQTMLMMSIRLMMGMWGNVSMQA